jgi:hypothetical protein
MQGASCTASCSASIVWRLCAGAGAWTCAAHVPVASAADMLLPRCSLLQVNQLLVLADKAEGSRKYSAMGKWAAQLKAIHGSVLTKLM